MSQWMTTLIFGFAMDEAHCISQWRHLFRKSYSKLDKIRGNCSDGSIMASTATATHILIKDVITGLRITGCAFFQPNMNRPNLYWEVSDKNKKLYSEEIVEFIAREYPN